MQGSSLSPFTSDSDLSPERMISEGSLFSGMKLTKSSLEQEPTTSPYTITTPTPTAGNIGKEEGGEGILNEGRLLPAMSSLLLINQHVFFLFQ